MARILASTTPARGHLFPLVPILDELSRRGHQVALRTLASQVPSMRGRGLDAAPVSDRIEAIAHDDWRAGNPRAALAARRASFTQRAEHDAPDLARAIGQERPGRAAGRPQRLGSPRRRRGMGRPLGDVLSLPAACPLAGRAAVRAGAAAGTGPAGAATRPAAAPDRVRDAGAQMVPPVDRVRARLRLAPGGGAGGHLRPRPAAALPDRRAVRVAGPTRQHGLTTSTGRSLLVTTSSELQDDARLVKVALEALAQEPVAVLATLPAGDPARVRAPANARGAVHPPRPVLDRAVCAVTHGGMGATQKALAHGVPVCAVPFGRDQLELGGGSRWPAQAPGCPLRAVLRRHAEALPWTSLVTP